MRIYSYYYGASAGFGIGIRAQSKQLENLPIGSDLKDLSSMHALESSEHEGEMLSYLLQRGEYGIMGLSYIEGSKSSGYGRSAPCGLQYIAAEKDMEEVAPQLGKIVNFINFQKPTSASPMPLSEFPLNDSGYYYHNSPAVMAPLVDALVRTALSPRDNVLLVALPKGKNSDYATARYTIAEALGYLPIRLRTNIRFFTGLPVGEGVSDCLVGYDNAVKFGANVIFCPNEYLKRLKPYRSFTDVDMDQPARQAGAFASYITRAPGVSEALKQIDGFLEGEISYEGLNKAAQRVQRGELNAEEQLKQELKALRRENKTLEESRDSYQQKYEAEHDKYEDLKSRRRSSHSHRQGLGVMFWVVLVIGVIAVVAMSVILTWMISTGFFAPRTLNNPDATPLPTFTEEPVSGFPQGPQAEYTEEIQDPLPAEQTENAGDTSDSLPEGQNEESAVSEDMEGDIIYEDASAGMQFEGGDGNPVG